MTLTAHAIVGAGIAAAMPAHPVLGVTLAFASHFLVDAIPHYDYQIRSASIHPNKGGSISLDMPLFLDLASIGTDFALGLLLSLIFFANVDNALLVLVAAFAGQLPDALQFAYLKIKREPLIVLLKFHHFIHTSYHMRAHPLLGIFSQVGFIAAFVFLTRLLFIGG